MYSSFCVDAFTNLKFCYINALKFRATTVAAAAPLHYKWHILKQDLNIGFMVAIYKILHRYQYENLG
jgi:hypothetical protein